MGPQFLVNTIFLPVDSYFQKTQTLQNKKVSKFQTIVTHRQLLISHIVQCYLPLKRKIILSITTS